MCIRDRFMALLLLAGLLAVPPELYESAMVDGASPFQIFTRITLPMIKGVVAIAVIFRVLELLRSFDIIYVVTFGGPGTSTETMLFYSYLAGFRYWDLGYAAAIGWILVIILSIVVTIFVRVAGV